MSMQTPSLPLSTLQRVGLVLCLVLIALSVLTFLGQWLFLDGFNLALLVPAFIFLGFAFLIRRRR